ncbi:MAG: tetratricopeptide repeat protein [Candidatus Heimdallarchaeota archaeon]
MQEFYLAFDQGNHKAVFIELEQLEGEERLEGDLVVAIMVILDIEGDLERAKAIVDQILANTDLTQRIGVLARTQRALIFSWEGNHQEGWRELELARELFESLTAEEKARLRHYEASIYAIAAVLLSHEGNYLQTLENQFQAIDIAQDEAFPWKAIIPAIYNNIGLAYEHLGELDKALSAFERSLALFQELGNEINQAIPLGNIGRYYSHWMGNNDRALDYYQQSLEISQKYNWKRILAHTLHSMGSVHHSQGDFERALDLFQQSLRLNEEIKLVGWDYGQALPLYKIFLLYLELQELDHAKEYLKLLQEFCQTSSAGSAALPHTLSLFAEALSLKNSDSGSGPFKKNNRRSQLRSRLQTIGHAPSL